MLKKEFPYISVMISNLLSDFCLADLILRVKTLALKLKSIKKKTGDEKVQETGVVNIKIFPKHNIY